MSAFVVPLIIVNQPQGFGPLPATTTLRLDVRVEASSAQDAVVKVESAADQLRADFGMEAGGNTITVGTARGE